MEWYKWYQDEVNAWIVSLFSQRYNSINSSESKFQEAMRYAVEWWGKRIRIILAILSYEHTHGSINRETLIRGLIWLECIHAYTLVHDDMPCMDNDELRRGKPTVWKKYGETLATLVGDGLQTLGFELLASLWNIAVIQEISRSLWDMWVVLGQVQDTIGLQTDMTYDELMQLHDRKTGGFIASSLVIGATLGGASEKQIQAFRDIGFLLGRAFQIRDDILDYEGDSISMGKNTGKDVVLGKGIVAKIWIEKAKEELLSIRNQLISITSVGFSRKIQEIAIFIVDRQN